MLKKPKYGWSRITIGDWSDSVSYIDDVPGMLLNALIDSCRNHHPVAVKFDAEGYEYVLLFDWQCSYVLYQSVPFVHAKPLEEEPEVLIFDVERKDVAAELIQDIRTDIDDWAQFEASMDSEETAAKNKERLLALCDELEGLLPGDDYKLVYSSD